MNINQFSSPEATYALRRLAFVTAATIAVAAIAWWSVTIRWSGHSTPTASAAAVDYFLKLDGIPGESSDPGHTGEIMLDSFSFGESNPGVVRGGSGKGKASFSDFHFVTPSSKASPKLMLAAANGKHFPKAVLTVRKTGTDQQEYYKVTLSDIMVSSYQTSGGGTAVVPTDQFSLNFTKIEFEYKPQKADGTLDTAVKAGWDLKLNKGI